MRYLGFVFILSFSMLLAACNEQQLGTNEQMESTDIGYMQMDNSGSVVYDQNGEERNEAADSQTILQAAEKVPKVKAQSVEFDGVDAFVTVKVNEPLNEAEKNTWESTIQSAIEGSIYQYQIHVVIED